MTNIAKLSRSRQHSPQTVLRVHPVAAACSLLLLAMGAAQAQTAPAPSTETVVVTGIRHAIETSVAAKRNSDSIVEAISAEDIGKLPDVSIAESLARLPGLAGQRVNGRAQVIAIRGMSQDFAGTTFNGREQTTTGVNRGVEFDQYPAELMSGAVVYKTPDATVLGQGLSGTVDLHSVRPLDVGSRALVVNLRGEHNSNGALNGSYGGTSANGERISGAYIDQFADRTIGVALGLAHLNAPGQEKHYKAWWWGQPGGTWFNGATAMGGAEVEAVSRKEARDGLMGVLEFKPNKDLHSTVDLYYSTFKQTEVMRGVMWDSHPWNEASQPWQIPAESYSITNPGYSTAAGSTILTSGTLTFPVVANKGPVVRNDFNKRDDKLSSVGWNTEAKLADWKAIADLSYSSAKRSDAKFETYAGATATNSIGFNIPTGGGFPTFTPGIDMANPDLIVLRDPANWGHDGRKEVTNQDDTLKAINLHAKHALGGMFSDIDAGVNYSQRDKNRNYLVYFANLPGYVAGKVNPTQVIAPNLLTSPASLGFAGIQNILSYDVNGVASQYYNMVQNMSSGPTGDQAKNYGVHEKITTAYAKANIDTDLAGIPIRGNVGVQAIHTQQYSNAYAFDPKNANAIAGTITPGTSYNDFLPSLNLVGDFGNGQILRFGLAKTLARPRIDDMNASSNASVDVTTHLWGGDGGNPKLKPWRATSVDLSLEKYFGKRSYVAAAVFYKDLSTYIYKQKIPYDFTGYINATPTVVPVSAMGTYTTQANGHGGYMNGIELSAAIEGSMISPSLDGFGMQLSASTTGSSIKINGPTGTALWETLPGLSEEVAGLTVYYEKEGFAVRVADRYRSDFRGEYSTLFGQSSLSRTVSQNIVDFQASYEFQHGAVKGLSFVFQVANLNNAPDSTIQDGSGFGGATAPQVFNSYGRQYILGVNYKL